MILKLRTPLYPRYVSTVDSGNLVGYLWVVAQALEEYLSNPIFNLMQAKGLQDTMRLASEEIEAIHRSERIISWSYSRDIDNDKIDFNSWKTMLVDLATKIIEVEKIGKEKELYWNKKLKGDVDGFLEEINEFFPWFDYAL